MLMYNRELVLPIDVKHNLDKDESNEREHREGNGNEEKPLSLDFFDAIFSSATKVRATIADENIKSYSEKRLTRL